ncbi:MAG: hypothetical protein KBD37_05525 [Burkholderiales bacterium]|nr:hypothetical protein [Burkholderiales bacterium]
MSIYNQIQSIYQIGNMLVYNGKNILLEDKTAYEVLQTFLTTRELELLNQHITDYFNADVSHYNQDLITSGRDKLAGYGFAVIAKEHGLDIYVKTNSSTNELKYLTSTIEDRHLQKLYNYMLYVTNNQNIAHMPEKIAKKHLQDLIRSRSFHINVPHIAAISNSTSEYCFSYIPLEQIRELNKNGVTPAWNNFLLQFNLEVERELFMAFVYSIFKADNFGRQILWLQGAGLSGKSTVVNVIADELKRYGEHLVRTIAGRFNFDKYSFDGLDQARLSIVSDTKERALLSRPEILQITGNDYVHVQGKFKQAKTIKIFNKVIAVSNVSPFVSINKLHETSRMLYLRLDTALCKERFNYWYKNNNSNNRIDWKAQLHKEFDKFLANCADYYYQCLNTDGSFIVSEVLWDKLEENSISSYRNVVKTFVDNCLVHIEGKRVSLKSSQERLKKFTGVKSVTTVLAMELYQTLETDGYRIETLQNKSVKIMAIMNCQFKNEHLTFEILQKQLIDQER